MKRILILTLALCLIFSLAACAKENSPATTEAPKTDAPATTEAPKTEAPATTEAPETEAPTTTEAPATTEAPTDTEPDEIAPVRGEKTKDAYINESLNLKIAKPKGWFYYTDEQMAQISNMTVDAYKETDVAEIIEKSGQLMDLMMADLGGSNLNLLIQPKNPMLDLYSDEQIFTLSEEMFKTQFLAAGMEVKDYEAVSMQVGGEEHTVLHLVLTMQGAEVDEYQIWFRGDSDYMGIATLSIQDGSDPQLILDGITALN